MSMNLYKCRGCQNWNLDFLSLPNAIFSSSLRPKYLCLDSYTRWTLQTLSSRAKVRDNYDAVRPKSMCLPLKSVNQTL